MRIGARVRGKHDRKEVEAKKAEGVLPGQSRQEKAERAAAEKEAAVLRIQTRGRGKQDRKAVEARKAAGALPGQQRHGHHGHGHHGHGGHHSGAGASVDKNKEQAAARIGARVRGKHDRKAVETRKAEGVLPGQPRLAAAGLDAGAEDSFLLRLEAAEARDDEKTEETEPVAAKSGDDEAEPARRQAAARIGARARGAQDRKDVEARKAAGALPGQPRLGGAGVADRPAWGAGPAVKRSASPPVVRATLNAYAAPPPAVPGSKDAAVSKALGQEAAVTRAQAAARGKQARDRVSTLRQDADEKVAAVRADVQQVKEDAASAQHLTPRFDAPDSASMWLAGRCCGSRGKRPKGQPLKQDVGPFNTPLIYALIQEHLMCAVRARG